MYGFKRITAAILTLLLIFSLGACKDNKEKDKAETKKETTQTTEEAQTPSNPVAESEPEPEVTEITSVTEETIKEYATQNGAESVTVNDDGSVDLEMDEEDFNAMMEKLRKSILDKLDQLKQSTDIIETVQSGLDFDKYYISVNKENYEANPSLIDISDCCASAELYQLYDGRNTEQIEITLYILNQDDDTQIAKKVYSIK